MKNALPGIAVTTVLVVIISYAPGPWLLPKPAAGPRPVVKGDIFSASPAPRNAEAPLAPTLATRTRSAPPSGTAFIPEAFIESFIEADEPVMTAAAPVALTPLRDVPAASTISALSALRAPSEPGSIEFVGATDAILAMAPPSAAESAAKVLPHSIVRGIATARPEQAELASTSAFASIMNGVPMNQSCPTSVCLDPPPKGITLRVYGQYLKDTQTADFEKDLFSSYKSTGKMVGAGFLKDWSVATTLGLSIDYLDGEVKSGWADDARKNKVNGYVFNAHLKSSLMDKFPVDGRLFYGILDTRGDGTWGAGYDWNEDEHRSKMYGFSGKVGVPLVFGDDIKLAPSAGFQFIRLRSDAYGASAGQNYYDIGRVDSKSVTVPLNIEVKKEMVQCFGTFTPRLSLGFIREFSDSAIGVRAYNAAAASRFTPDGGVSGFGKSQEKFYKFGAGMDLNTVGGWAVRADYDYLWADKYKNHSVTLEASRCF